MGRSDDSIARRRSKRIRRKAEDKKDDASKVSSRVAAFIAAKKRRQTGKRRQCQGMCFSLPSPVDPFNDREGKAEPTRKRKFESKEERKKYKKKLKKKAKKDGTLQENLHEDKVIKSKVVDKRKVALVSAISFMGQEVATNLGKPTHQIIKQGGSNHSWEEHVSDHVVGSPSKFLMMCLNTIQNALHNGAALIGGKESKDVPLFADAWGLEFWSCYCTGTDVLEASGADSNMEQIAWIASTAADIISMKEKEGISLTGPFLLYLVPSQDKASEVRGVCKQLKVHGIHTVSLHSGAPIDHQIDGLNNCEPEFLVSTPERLLELISLEAVDISGVSLLVIDGLDSPFGAYFDAVKSIRQCISGSLRTVVFCNSMNKLTVPFMKKLLHQSANEMKLSSL